MSVRLSDISGTAKSVGSAITKSGLVVGLGPGNIFAGNESLAIFSRQQNDLILMLYSAMPHSISAQSICEMSTVFESSPRAVELMDYSIAFYHRFWLLDLENWVEMCDVANVAVISSGGGGLLVMDQITTDARR